MEGKEERKVDSGKGRRNGGDKKEGKGKIGGDRERGEGNKGKGGKGQGKREGSGGGERGKMKKGKGRRGRRGERGKWTSPSHPCRQWLACDAPPLTAAGGCLCP